MDTTPSRSKIDIPEGTPLEATMWTPPAPPEVEAHTDELLRKREEEPGLSRRLQQSAPVQSLTAAGQGARDLASRYPVVTAAASFALGVLVAESVRRYRR